MKILFNDLVQQIDFPNNLKALNKLKTPSLKECSPIPAAINFRDKVYFDCVGIGDFVGEEIRVNNEIIEYKGHGLYMLSQKFFAREITITTPANATIGRLAIGKAVHIPTTPVKGLTFASTANEQITGGGQVILGSGGYEYRTLTLDSRYKIDRNAMNEIIAGYKSIGKGYPFFIDLIDEHERLGFSKFYGVEKNQKNWVFQGGVRDFMYSMKFEFEECF